MSINPSALENRPMPPRSTPFIQHAAAAILDYYDYDVARVKAFYTEVDAKLHGLNPLVDAILDEIDRWLIPHTFDLSVGDRDQYVAFEL